MRDFGGGSLAISTSPNIELVILPMWRALHISQSLCSLVFSSINLTSSSSIKGGGTVSMEKRQGCIESFINSSDKKYFYCITDSVV